MGRWVGAALLVCLAALPLACSQQASSREVDGIMVVHPEKTEEVLINPGTGWQLLVHNPPRDEMEKLPLVSTFYYRAAWTAYESEPGRYADSPAVKAIDAWLAEAERHGRYVAIRVVPWNSKNPSYQRATAQKVEGYDSPVPAYVFEAGAKGFPEPGDSGGWVPVFWDPIYLRYHRELVSFLAERYRDHPQLAYVDVPAGNYGEMNLTNTRIPELDDLSLWKEHGLTAESWSGMIQDLCDMYREAFPNDLLVAARDYTLYEGGKDALPFAVAKGVGFRDDGLGMSYCGPGQSNPEYETHWPEVLCLYENGFGSWINWGDKERVRAILEWAVEQTHASIVMVGKEDNGLRSYREFLPLVEEYGQRVGYRLVVETARYPAAVQPGGELPISLVWRNLGNSPPYVDFALELSLLGPRGRVVCSRVVSRAEVGTTDWLPGVNFPLRAALPVPVELSPGQYRVAVSLFEPLPGRPTQETLKVKRRIRLGLRGEDANTRYPLGKVKVETGGRGS